MMTEQEQRQAQGSVAKIASSIAEKMQQQRAAVENELGLLFARRRMECLTNKVPTEVLAVYDILVRSICEKISAGECGLEHSISSSSPNADIGQLKSVVERAAEILAADGFRVWSRGAFMADVSHKPAERLDMLTLEVVFMSSISVHIRWSAEDLAQAPEAKK